MIVNPWKLDAEAWEYIIEFPEEQRADAATTYIKFNYNSIKVPCITAFAMYALFVVLILTASVNNLLARSCPSLHFQLKRRSRVVRAYFWEHPLVRRRHATVASFSKMQWLSLQLPLRGEAAVILILCLINFIPLVAFYDLFIGDRNVFYPGPTSKRDQICRHLADRTGILGNAQLPLLILMASKRTPLAIVSGLGMNRLMLYHRWISRWFWIHILIHTLAYTAIYMRGEGGVAVMLKDTYIRWGVVALAMAFGLVFLSLRALRQRFYEVFVMLHIVMAFFAILGTYLHVALIEYPQYEIYKVMTEIAAAVWAFDRIVRFAARIYLSFSLGSSPSAVAKDGSQQGSYLLKCATGQIRAFGVNADYTRLRISVAASKLCLAGQSQGLMRGIAAGDDVRITIPRLQWVGEHPFTVFSAGSQQHDPTQGYIELLVKTEAGLTRRLANDLSISAHSQGNDKDVETAGTSSRTRDVAVLIEGPFGVAPEINEATTDMVLVAGGIAITFCWPLFVAAVKSSYSAAAHKRLASCKLVWIVRQSSTLTVLEEAFIELVDQLRNMQIGNSCQFSMDIYVTSASSSLPASLACSRFVKEEAADAPKQRSDLAVSGELDLSSDSIELPVLSHTEHDAINDQKPQCRLLSDRIGGQVIKVSHFNGRPQLLSSSLFGHLDQDSMLQEHNRNLFVGLCGPASLCDDVRIETIRLLKKGINVDLFEDCFTW